MKILPVLRDIELFSQLDDEALKEIAVLCKEKSYHLGEIIAIQGEEGKDILIITQGCVEILVNDPNYQDVKRVVANLGIGQIIGEMGLVDHGKRSAKVRAIEEPTEVQIISYEELSRLCETNTQIGYIIMKNLAADISFKLRHANLISS